MISGEMFFIRNKLPFLGKWVKFRKRVNLKFISKWHFITSIAVFKMNSHFIEFGITSLDNWKTLSFSLSGIGRSRLDFVNLVCIIQDFTMHFAIAMGQCRLVYVLRQYGVSHDVDKSIIFVQNSKYNLRS